MIATKIGSRPYIEAYQLLAKLRHLTLLGVDDDGELEWCGTYKQWAEVNSEELKLEYESTCA